MKRHSFILFVQLVFIVYANTLSAETVTEIISLQEENFKHIKFSRIKPNHHVFHDQQLQINVDDSASFLMQAFSHVRQVNHVSFEWRSDGIPQTKNVEHEAQRRGDDAVFKLGLLLKTNDSLLLNPFLPPWMKRVETLLNFPSENMIYLVVDAKHSVGERWANPYNKRATMLSIASTNVSTENKRDWKQASYRFDIPVSVVALWLMSDGDNTHSNFTVHIKNIRIK
jgi:hypothetical protein